MDFRHAALPGACALLACLLLTCAPVQVRAQTVHQAPTAATAAPERAGTIKIVKGRVTGSDGKTERPLVPGDGLSVAEQLATGPASSASLVLRDGTVVVAGPSSRVELREFAFDATTYEGHLALGVLRGTMRMVSGLIRKNRPEAVRVETPTALIGIRGTDFIVDVDPAGETP